jgi:hypothetical protein
MFVMHAHLFFGLRKKRAKQFITNYYNLIQFIYTVKLVLFCFHVQACERKERLFLREILYDDNIIKYIMASFFQHTKIHLIIK